MDYPCVKLFSGENLSFPWTSSFKEVRDPDLKAFLHQCRTAISSIETELEQRQKQPRQGHSKSFEKYCEQRQKQPRRGRSKSFEKHCELLRKCADGINTFEELNDTQAKQVKIAVNIMTSSQTTRFEKTYQDILNDISRVCGPELVLLCAAALGKRKISHLNKLDRLHLLDHLKKESKLKVSRLAALVDIYKIPSRTHRIWYMLLLRVTNSLIQECPGIRNGHVTKVSETIQ